MMRDAELRLRRLGVALQSPILVRELRALLRGRKFFVSHMLLLSVLAGVLLVASTAAAGADTDPAALGKLLYWAFAAGFSVVIIFLVPAFSCTSITMEREARTMDLLLTTTIRPWEIVWGKLLGALVVIMLFMASALPLVTICFLFGGISPWDLAVLYLAVLFGTVVVSSVSLSVSAHCQESKSSVVISYVLTLIIVVVLAVFGGILAARLSGGLGGGALSAVISGLHWSEQVLLVVGPQLFGLAVFSWNFAAATNRLKPATANRSTGLRLIWLASLLTCVGFYWWLIVVETGVAALPGRSGIGAPDAFACAMTAMCVMFCLVWVGALYFSSEEAVQPPRVVEDTRRLSGLLVLLRVFMPGPLSGLFLAGLSCVVGLGGIAMASRWLPGDETALLLLGAGVLSPAAAFVLANAGLAALLSGLGFSRRAAGLGAFGVGVLLLAGPLVVHVLSDIAGDRAAALWKVHYLSPLFSMVVEWGSSDLWRAVRLPGGGSVPLPVMTTGIYIVLACGLWILAALAVWRARRRWRAHVERTAEATQPVAPAAGGGG